MTERTPTDTAQTNVTTSDKNETPPSTNLAPFNPSSETAQRQSIALMDLQASDILFDLGCGDGRLLIRAVSQVEGLRCVGVELDTVFVERAQRAVDQLSPHVQERIQIRCEDLTEILKATNDEDTSKEVPTKLDDVSIFDATVLYLYLLPRGLRQIKPFLDELVKRRLARGHSLRVVAYTFSVAGWEPVKVDTSTKSGVPIYLYQFS